MRIAEVVFPVPLPKGYHYRVPEGLAVVPGQRVRACLGPRRAVGTALDVFEGEPERPLKPLDGVVDLGPALSAEGVACARWMARRFASPIGECVRALLPAFVKSLDEEASFAFPPPRGPAAPPFELTAGQAACLARLEALLDARGPARAVLFGVPASGKTEVYLRLIRRAVQDGGQVVFLLPEIGLTRPFFDEFSSGLGVPVALWHSGLTERDRRRTWLGVRRGAVKVVVGARSACLLPFSGLRLAIIDEEQDESFKQDSKSPLYHARGVVLERARAFGALTVLGSATPSLEAWDLARRGAAELLEMPERVSRLERPGVRVIARPGSGEVLSVELADQIKERLARREQIILLVNRRGFSTLTACGKCRWIDRCPDCGVAKISHEAPAGADGRAGWTLLCHHCGKDWPPPERCAQCGSLSVSVSGAGTQRVAAEVKRRFPGARVLRMDRDTLSKEHKLEGRIYDQFRARKADILVGTKLVAKSFHFPDVTLVGVVDADTMLHMPDFRSSERTMQLLAQVAGRSGRADKPGEVILQTLSPDHDAIRGAASGDYAAWADGELAVRRDLRYPPAAELLRLVLSGKAEARVAAEAGRLGEALRGGLGGRVEVVGPAPALLREVRGKFRHHLLVKLAPGEYEAALAAIRAHRLPSSVRLSLDVDPYDMF